MTKIGEKNMLKIENTAHKAVGAKVWIISCPF